MDINVNVSEILEIFIFGLLWIEKFSQYFNKNLQKQSKSKNLFNKNKVMDHVNIGELLMDSMMMKMILIGD